MYILFAKWISALHFLYDVFVNQYYAKNTLIKWSRRKSDLIKRLKRNFADLRYLFTKIKTNIHTVLDDIFTQIISLNPMITVRLEKV